MVTVLSTFAGCGGSSLGYKMAGYTEILAIEWDRNAVETFKLNFPDIPIWQKDIKEVTGEEILKFCKIQKGELDLFDGSPPCQGFSTAGKRQVIDPRNDLFNEFVRLIKDLQPKVFVMENVSGMVKGKMKGRFKEIILELKSTGYNVKCKKLNTMWYGVPQSRERLIFIGVREDLRIEPSYPAPQSIFIALNTICHGIVASRSERINPWISAYYPCCTITKDPYKDLFKTLNGIREPSLIELKEISSFPKEFQFANNKTKSWGLMGNSVPPKFMEAIAGYIKREILEHENRQT